jgi:MraZ protein
VFLGEYKHTIDEKGRLVFPACFRDLLQNGAYLARGFDHNLIVWPADIFDQILNRLSDLSVTDPDTRLLRRKFFSQAVRVEFDRAGRILLPQNLRDAASLHENAVITGVGETVEIWAGELWQAQEALLEDDDANNERYEKFNLPLR